MPDEITVTCWRCGTTLTADSDQAGEICKCPKCSGQIEVPQGAVLPPAVPAIPPRLPHRPAPAVGRPEARSPSRGIILAGWICFAVGMCIAVPLFFLPIYVPLFVASFVLGIIAVAKKRTGAGLALIFSSVLVPPILIVAMLFIMAAAVTEGVARPTRHPTFRSRRTVQPVQRPSGQSTVQPQEMAESPIVPPVPLVKSPTPGPAPAPSIPPRQLASLPFASFLGEMTRYADEFKAARTTAQKEDVRQRARLHAAKLLENRQLVLRVAIADVSIPQDGVARVSPGKVDLGANSASLDKAFQIIFRGRLDIPATREQALRLCPGIVVEIPATLTFATISNNAVTNALIGGNKDAVIHLRGDLTPLGHISLHPNSRKF